MPVSAAAADADADAGAAAASSAEAHAPRAIARDKHDDSSDGAAPAPTSPLSTPTTATSPVSPTFLSVAGRVSTPLSLFVDSAPGSGSKKLSSPSSAASPTGSNRDSAATVRQRYLAMSSSSIASALPADKMPVEARSDSGAESAAVVAAAQRMRRGLQLLGADVEEEEEEEEEEDEAGWAEKSTGARTGPPLPWSPRNTDTISSTNAANSSNSNNNNNNNSSSSKSNITIAAASASAAAAPDTGKHDISRGVISAPLPPSPDARARPGHYERPSNSAWDSHIATTEINPPLLTASSNPANYSTTAATVRSPASSSTGLRRSPPEDLPLHTGSVQPGTKLAHPKPILHIATDSISTSSSRHAELLSRSSSAVSNVAHLEATAERLSMTSSIDDAIRELHCELKRSDSRRSSILAARAASADDNNSATGRLRRFPSNSSTSAAAAARQKGYSPAAYVMSPTNSLTGRMRSGSNASTGRPEHDAINSILSRHGPGKSSVRSVRSAKPSLAEISESEPISLTQHVLDAVDAGPPIEHPDAAARRIIEHDAVGVPHTDDFHEMLEGGFRSHRASNLVLVNPDLPSHYDDDHYEAERPMTANSTNTFQVAQDAFVDFDGAHCETDTEEDRFATATISPKRDRLSAVQQQQQPQQQQQQQQQQPPPPAQLPPQIPQPPVVEDDMPTPQRSSAEFVRPQSYFDHHTGQHMLYYPARVPAMLNLPPKLSNKPKATDRNQRRSQILGAMMQPKDNKRKSVVPDLDQFALPDPLSGHRNSFAALSVADGLDVGDDATTPTPFLEEPAPQSRHGSAPSMEDLRRPQRLSKMDGDKRKSNMTNLDNIPPHLRASVFFDQPSTELPEIEVKDGSAMATLDSILDASATAPVSAFTDHLYAGKLGAEVYGKEKKKTTKHKAQQPSTNTLGATLGAAADPSKRGSTIKLLTKRSKSSLAGALDDAEPGVNGPVHDEAHDEANAEEYEEEEEVEEGIHDGMPTTLLGEIQIRKQRQKERILNQGNIAPQGMRATLLEMDAVAELQRKQRLKNRVNLAWEEQNVPAEHHLSDDEDVPLAVIAAMHQGAKNLADLDRPLGLMEVRELEENEPLSQRAARLQGRASAVITAKRQSNLSLPATRIAEVQPAISSPRIVSSDMGDDDTRTTIATDTVAPAEEIEEETLGARKRRLAESQLPKARPVSNAFSMELLSQFGDLDESKGKSDKGGKSPNPGTEEETLGQRRRRLQAEREAREREMSYGNLTGERLVAYGNLTGETPKRVSRRVSMADMLSVHQTVQDPRIAEGRRRQEEQMRIAEQDAKMAAMRAQMPTALVAPGNARTGGFKGGLYNDGTGGLGIEAARSSAALNTFQSRSFTNTGPRNRATMMMPPNAYGGMPQGGVQPVYGLNPAAMHSMNAVNTMSMYGAGNPYGANGFVQPGVNMGLPMSMTMANGSMDRVERWRQGVFP